jgi:hypothetical protein
MTTDVETVVSETIEKVNEWLRNAVTKHGKTVYRPFVLEEPHYKYESFRTFETAEGKLFADIWTAWDYICWSAREGEEADKHGLAGDWFLTIRLTVTPTGPNSPFEHPDDDNPMVTVVRERVAELSGFGDEMRGTPTVEKVGHRPSYTWRWKVRRTVFCEEARVQLVAPE